MDAIGPDPLAPHDDLQEDLQAALAEIDKVSTESPTTLEAPGDGLGQSGDAPPPGNPPSPSPESVESDPTEAAETPTADSDPAAAAEPTDDDLTTPVESPEKIDDPLRETAALPAETPVFHAEPAPPSPPTPHDSEEPAATAMELEPPPTEQPAASATPEDPADAAEVAAPDDAGPAVASETSRPPESRLVDDQLSALFSDVEEAVGEAEPAPSEVNPDTEDTSGTAPESEQSETDAPAPNEETTEEEAAPAEPPAQDKKLRFKIGKKAAKQKAAAPPPPAPPRKRREVDPAIQPATPWGKRLFRVADEALDKVNRPFERMQERTKALVGCAALTTLIVSALAMIAMPLILPHRDATMFLQEKRAALDAPLPAQEAGEEGTPAPRDE